MIIVLKIALTVFVVTLGVSMIAMVVSIIRADEEEEETDADANDRSGNC